MQETGNATTRFAGTLTVALLSGFFMTPARGAVITNWYAESHRAPTGTVVASGRSVVLHEWFKADSCSRWAPVPPVDLVANGAATFSCTLRLQRPVAPEARDALRVSMLGRPAGARDIRTLRGYMIAAGRNKGRWVTKLWERRPGNGFPGTIRDCDERAVFMEDKPAADDTVLRVVMSVRRAADGACDVSGFIGSHAFSFTGLRPANPVTDVQVVGLLLGPDSGTLSATAENSRIVP